ncbi:hypothetical protein CHS0354_026976 [Potamilus streckersoni]|uniref:Uncharacterized protein n=1 Tax=Potamilus streckersoni TaxID=2493646 RepID=A0AAE0VT90_9BIVA|nr:hypothetical protein CHS0354_026976 [Potamilus streckersoni]
MNTMGRSVQDFTMEDNLADQKSCSVSRDTLIPCRNYGNQGNQSTTSIRSADMPISLRNRSRSNSNSDTCSTPLYQRKKIRIKRKDKNQLVQVHGKVLLVHFHGSYNSEISLNGGGGFTFNTHTFIK